MKRKGMMKGKGRGYKNVIGKDPMVHSQSARGIKQPQKVHFIPEPFGLPRELQQKDKFYTKEEKKDKSYYEVTVPATMTMGSYRTTVTGSDFQSKEQEALQDYNSAREHDGLPPLKRMPRGTNYFKRDD